MSTNEKQYKSTLQLPSTSFPMKANLPQREPEWLKAWNEERLYERIRAKSAPSDKRFVLHDGPPYANGHIHMGHAFNKILKDIIVKYKTMQGFDAPYVPGWDCHGLPIELALFKELGKRKEEVDQVPFRKKARQYAEKYISIQREEFIRLGVFGDWEKPYLTMASGYQAKIAASFLALLEAGYIEQRLKPVPWCYDCETALAEAELEYEDKTSPSVYVGFKAANQDFSFLVWTTTPWTLPGNVALAVHPDLEYVFLETDRGRFCFAQPLVDLVSSKLGFKKILKTGSEKGKNLVGAKAKHPFLDRTSQVVSADFVSSTDGTGIVHIAPGHGEEDYVVGLKYKLEQPSPVDEKGRFTKEFPRFEGMNVFKANGGIIALLKDKEVLFHEEPFQHQYPFCWRCKNPIIFRATRQWFLKVDHEHLRRKLKESIEHKIKFTPDWGKKRIGSMIETRPDWCLSRQRYWGVPIPVIRCASESCGKILARESKDKIISTIAHDGADAWFERRAADFLPEGFVCSCGSNRFTKESDIIDVWFDSGVSHQAVLKGDQALAYPASLYLEGSDQHRGWFQTALITGVALDDQVPFESVLTHGFVVDGEGKKMSKSRGNVVSPQEVMKDFGADVLRLWVAASDYQFDVRMSREILSQTVEGYRRIRNTFRFLLGNLHDFDYESDKIPFGEITAMDRWALGKCLFLVRSVSGYYDDYLFHYMYRAVQEYLVVDLSSFYLDVLKDRLYTAAKTSVKRRSAQTALFYILRNLVKILAPILPFTCDEVWRSYKIQAGVKSVHEVQWPGDYPELRDASLLKDWEDLFAVRDAVNRKLEERREAKEIGSSLEARLELSTPEPELERLLKRYEGDLREILIVSQVEVKKGVTGSSVAVSLPSDRRQRELGILIERARGTKCERCWNYSERVGASCDHPTLCERCVEAVGA
ncbi:MAG: isoleucine--tRNA ligase [Omnitrophica bacterium RIFCSPLOWO2_01_FULL_50_24]|nr:MAG: isoleucine--tRNA ligase [Omnitrophica bacterium RIFCSPLOWO2_01_FULL_50_24]